MILLCLDDLVYIGILKTEARLIWLISWSDTRLSWPAIVKTLNFINFHRCRYHLGKVSQMKNTHHSYSHIIHIFHKHTSFMLTDPENPILHCTCSFAILETFPLLFLREGWIRVQIQNWCMDRGLWMMGGFLLHWAKVSNYLKFRLHKILQFSSENGKLNFRLCNCFFDKLAGVLLCVCGCLPIYSFQFTPLRTSGHKNFVWIVHYKIRFLWIVFFFGLCVL